MPTDSAAGERQRAMEFDERDVEAEIAKLRASPAGRFYSESQLRKCAVHQLRDQLRKPSPSLRDRDGASYGPRPPSDSDDDAGAGVDGGKRASHGAARAAAPTKQVATAAQQSAGAVAIVVAAYGDDPYEVAAAAAERQTQGRPRGLSGDAAFDAGMSARLAETMAAESLADGVITQAEYEEIVRRNKLLVSGHQSQLLHVPPPRVARAHRRNSNKNWQEVDPPTLLRFAERMGMKSCWI